MMPDTGVQVGGEKGELITGERQYSGKGFGIYYNPTPARLYELF
jgi:hypothetical protein